MKGQVIVTKPQNYTTGEPHPKYDIITISGKNKEFGSIMLRQEKLVLSPGSNIANIQARVAHFAGTLENLESIVENFNLKEGDNFNKIMPVDLVVEEQTEPFYDGQDPKINPSTGEIVTHNGQEVYRSTFIAQKGEERTDQLLRTDPSEETVGQKAQTEFSRQEQS